MERSNTERLKRRGALVVSLLFYYRAQSPLKESSALDFAEFVLGTVLGF